MANSSSILVAVLLGAALTAPLAAMAAEVTDTDLMGKKICWNNGGTSAYNKDGSFDSNRMGHGTWCLNGDLLTVSADHGAGANTITKDGTTFHTTHRAGRSGKDIEAWGSYCN